MDEILTMASSPLPSTRIFFGPPPAATQPVDVDYAGELDMRQEAPAQRRRERPRSWFFRLARLVWRCLFFGGVLSLGVAAAGTAWRSEAPLQALAGAAAQVDRLREVLVPSAERFFEAMRQAATSAPAYLEPVAAPTLATASTNAAAAAQVGIAEQVCPGSDPQAAGAAFRDTLRQNPRDAAARLGVGYCLLRQPEQVAASVAWFTDMLRLEPWIGEAQLGLGLGLRQSGQPQAAQRHFRQVLAIAPEGSLGAAARQNLEQMAR